MTGHPPLALITGAGSGIGRALAIAADSAGYELVLVGRRIEQLEETAALLGRANSRIISADITSAKGRARVAQAVGDRLDILVNNAGLLRVGRLTDMTDDDLSQIIATNLMATVQLTRDLIPALSAAQGRIVNIGSMFGIIAFPFFAVYSATKFATRGLSDALRRELAEFGISVTYVAPRATRTPAQARFAHLVEPFGMKLDTPEHVARHAWAGVMKGRNTVYPGMGERIFATIQSILPTVIDSALIKKAHSSRAQFALAKFNEQKEI